MGAMPLLCGATTTMKILIAFVLGACTGACLLWFGFSQEVLVLNSRLVRLDRFTGKASLVFVSALELERGEQVEEAQRKAQKKALAAAAKLAPAPAETKPGAAAPKAATATKPATPEWRELTAEEIKQLECKWRRNGSSGVVLSFHNPFEKKVRINRVQVRIAAHAGSVALDRMYELKDCTCEALADKSEVLDTQGIDWDVIVPAKDGETITAVSPFGAQSPDASTPHGVMGSITPVQVMMAP
jgi:hypothetical protein